MTPLSTTRPIPQGTHSCASTGALRTHGAKQLTARRIAAPPPDPSRCAALSARPETPHGILRDVRMRTSTAASPLILRARSATAEIDQDERTEFAALGWPEGQGASACSSAGTAPGQGSCIAASTADGSLHAAQGSGSCATAAGQPAKRSSAAGWLAAQPIPKWLTRRAMSVDIAASGQVVRVARQRCAAQDRPSVPYRVVCPNGVESNLVAHSPAST
jgi:hypothetical protein